MDYYLFIEGKAGVLKYVTTQDSDVLDAIYGHYKEKPTIKPAPQTRMGEIDALFALAHGWELATTSPDGFVEARFINEIEFSGFFEKMNRQYAK